MSTVSTPCRSNIVVRYITEISRPTAHYHRSTQTWEAGSDDLPLRERGEYERGPAGLIERLQGEAFQGADWLQTNLPQSAFYKEADMDPSSGGRDNTFRLCSN